MKHGAFTPYIDGLVKHWCAAVTEDVSSFDDCYGDSRVEQVENESRSGFTPYTAGGYDGIVYANLGYAQGSGAIPAVIKPYIESGERDCEADWDEQNPEWPAEKIFRIANQESGQLTLDGLSAQGEAEQMLEKYQEFEDEWMREGGTYFYKVRALYYDSESSTRPESGEPEIYFMVGINTDFEYGRDNISWLTYYGSDPQCTKWEWECLVRARELTPALIMALKKEAFEALRNA